MKEELVKDKPGKVFDCDMCDGEDCAVVQEDGVGVVCKQCGRKYRLYRVLENIRVMTDPDNPKILLLYRDTKLRGIIDLEKVPYTIEMLDHHIEDWIYGRDPMMMNWKGGKIKWKKN